MAILKGDIDFTLGQKITATILGDSYNICIRGWVVKEYIITDIPKLQGQSLRVPAETGCQINYIRDGVVCMFQTYVVSLFAHSVSFMILEYPKTHEKIKLRKSQRPKVRLKATYSEGPESMTERATMRDLTSRGALICHLRPLAKASKITLNIEFPDQPVENLQAVVCNVRHNRKNEKEPCVTGLKFTLIPDPAQKVLKKFLENQAMMG